MIGEFVDSLILASTD